MNPLAAAIDEAYPRLTPQEQRVAELLRRRPEEAALSSGSELAALAGVSKATVSRLFRRLGFAGAAEVRSLMWSQRASGVPVAAPAVDSAPGDRIGRHLRSELDALTRMFERLDPAALDAAARAIAEARRVLVVGWRSGYPLAAALRAQLAQAREDVRLIPEPGQSLGEELEGLGADDVVLVVALRRRPATAARVLRALAAGPVRVVVLTDPTGRRIADGAEVVLEFPVDAPGAFDSHAAAASLVSLLADAVFTAVGPAAEQRSASIAARYTELSELEGR